MEGIRNLMERRQFIFALALVSMSLAVPASVRDSICPVCHGKVVDSADLNDDLSKPSRNLEVWPRGADCLALGGRTRPVCTRCWYALKGNAWIRSSERPDDFHHSLTYAIAAFPMQEKKPARGHAIYTQTLYGADASDGAAESLAFWTLKSDTYIAAIRQYSRLHGLHLVMEDHRSGEIYVTADIDMRPASPWAGPDEDIA